MKTFDSLYAELKLKVAEQAEGSRTVEEFNAGKHAIGKKIVEEAAEVWMASEFEGKEAAVGEISQLLYHVQVMMLANDITPEEIYEAL
ncbi:MAG: phosphoribosyl-ATP diphosphatase [Candidatus Ancillula sp.]|jgi:phosphoribosyl-ATP pyrophosphohydrolase|nr:phosphoribosyl-ATP diphosphatase [Candidatus Ancillula sp.]